jgi:RNA polymerase sigma-70 factor (ECF subfamily)
MAFLVLLERLTPEERAVFLLREVFEYPYDEIANMLEKSEGACRQALHRARVHIAASRPRFSPSPRQHSKIFKAFVGAIGNGDLQQLESLLAEDVGLVADGGGRIRGAAIHPLHGRGDVSRFLIGSLRFAPEGVTPEVEEVNGQPAIVLRSQGQAFIVVMLELDDEKINVVRLFGNPQKLSAL